jgi:hypothetical protein
MGILLYLRVEMLFDQAKGNASQGCCATLARDVRGVLLRVLSFRGLRLPNGRVLSARIVLM